MPLAGTATQKCFRVRVSMISHFAMQSINSKEMKNLPGVVSGGEEE